MKHCFSEAQTNFASLKLKYMKIKKGDKVKILLGKDQSKIGKVDRVFEKSGEVLVGGFNIYKRHLKPRSEQDKSSGGIIDLGRPLKISKVALICPKCDKAVRIGYQTMGDKKVRICRSCKAEI